MTQVVTTILSLLTILANIIALLVLFDSWYYRGREEGSRVLRFVDTHGLELMFAASGIAMVGSLYYSLVAGYTPCTLCWYQRIAMYPIAFIAAVGLIKERADAFLYALPLSIVGIILSGYHYLLQVGVIETSSCAQVGYSISCSERFVLNFGYITIPMMALSAFVLIALISWRKSRRI